MKIHGKDDEANSVDNAESVTTPVAGDGPDSQSTDAEAVVNELGQTAAAQVADQDLYEIINDQQAQITDLTNLVQHTRADFENYRKHTEADLERARQVGRETVVKKLLPIIDVLDLAMGSMPDELVDNDWAKGIAGAHKNLDKMMADLGLSHQDVKAGDKFDHNQHEAIALEDGDGEQEVISEVLRPGYLYHDIVLRPAMVKVVKK